MRRRRLLTFLGALPLVGADQSPETDNGLTADNLLQFNHQYAKLFRAYFGCPPTGEYSVEMCVSSLGMTNVHAYSQAREAAKRLFDLRE